MQHFSKLEENEDTIEAVPDEPVPQASPSRMLYRGDQKLTNVIGSLFSISSFVCLIAISVLGVFFVKIVGQSGEVGMLPVFIALGLSIVIGMLLLEFTHARALAGYRAARERNARRSRTFTSIVLCLLLAMIHPLMALAVPIAATIGTLGHFLLHRFSKSEPLWDFLSTEAVSILAGRDKIGMVLSSTRPNAHVMAHPMTQAGVAVSFIASLATGSYLVAEDIMTMAAFIPLIFGSLLATQAILEFVEGWFFDRDTDHVPASKVERIEVDHEEDQLGLDVQGLSIRNAQGQLIMADVNLRLEPGKITGVIGSSGSGKSLLLQAISDPFSLTDLEISGRAYLGQTDLWMRGTTEQNTHAVFLPSEPIMLPASGEENLSCFHGGDMLERGKWILERFVFAIDMVKEICATPNAQTLPSMQKKALSLARAFMLGPPLYLMDRPEDGLPEKQVSALLHRLQQETRMGRSILMVTNNRKLFESCDLLVVMNKGRIVNYGPAPEILKQMDNGWQRFIGVRQLETEETLTHWIDSNFHRDGDDENRRKVAGVATDMLALSCQSADGKVPGQVQFMLKHFEGYCLLQMQDGDAPLSVIAINKAQTEADGDIPDHKLPSFASILRYSMAVECNSKQIDRQITAQIATYDPRKTSETGNAR